MRKPIVQPNGANNFSERAVLDRSKDLFDSVGLELIRMVLICPQSLALVWVS